MTKSPIDDSFDNFPRVVLQRLDKIEQDLESVKTDIGAVKQGLATIQEEFKGWTNWLRFASGTILFGVAITLVGLVLPIAIALWRQSLV